MKRRGYNHNSPLQLVTVPQLRGHVDREADIRDLQRRCPECNILIEQFNTNN
jgi:hypothetical protein